MSLTVEQTQAVPLASGADGVIRVSGTRVTLDTIVEAFQQGATAEEIAQQYPSLSLADVYSVLGYYLHHEAHVAAYLARRSEARAKTRSENEGRFNPAQVRARLRARLEHLAL